MVSILEKLKISYEERAVFINSPDKYLSTKI
jgi:hypothetical protein